MQFILVILVIYRQFDYILTCKEKLLKENGLFIVDPAMADHGVLYKALDSNIVEGMKKICSVADYILPNITEACFLTNIEYKEKMDDTFITTLFYKLRNLGSKNIILTGIEKNNKIGASFYDGKKNIMVLKDKQDKSYHGTGDIFSSIIVANILNQTPMEDNLEEATSFIIESILKTKQDEDHFYGVKFEDVLKTKN